MHRDLGIGLVGASATRGWARISHGPAIRAVPGLRLAAVVGSSQASADAAASAFGAERAYGDAASLFADPGVDIVTIAVKVPDHRRLVLDAARAGKHVLCEWPLGRDRAEAEEMEAAVRGAGVHAAIGLQARMDPAVRQAHRLIDAGAIGRVLGARILSSTMAFGPAVEAALAFAEEPDGGVTLATIQGAHTIDLAIAVLGPLAEAGAMLTTQYPQVRIGDAVAMRARTTPDHMLLQGRLAGGAAVTIEIVGGRPPDAVPFRFEITGERGTLMLSGGAPRGVQSGRLRLIHDAEMLPSEDGALAALPDEAVNVARLYAALRDDIRSGTAHVPGFGHAVSLSRLLEAMAASDADGRRRHASGWPDRTAG